MDTKKVFISDGFWKSEDGKYIYIALGKNGCPTRGKAEILVRHNTEDLGENDIQLQYPPNKRWVNAGEPACMTPSVQDVYNGWADLLREIAAQERILKRCDYPSLFQERKEKERIEGGVAYGLSPEATGVQHIALHGSSDPRRIAKCNLRALGNDLEKVGVANATAYTGKPETIANCNFVSFDGDPVSVGKANAASFKSPEAIARANESVFPLASKKFKDSMYASFGDKPNILFQMFIFNYDKTIHEGLNKNACIASDMRKLFKEDIDAFKEAVLYLVGLPLEHNRKNAVSRIGRFFCYLVDDAQLGELTDYIFSTKEDCQLAISNARIEKNIESSDEAF